ncbi:MAG: hypothetical protein JSR77_10135 [Planctomycetes bacterium]|nr:hypothetical protein [Planctomycetota bacterium]
MKHPSSNPADSWFGRPPPDFARPPEPPNNEPATHFSDGIVNECLNLESEGELHEAMARLRAAAKTDPAIAERFNRTRRVLTLLEDAPIGPDLTHRVLSSVDERRPFLPRHRRRPFPASRIVAMSGVLAAIAVAFFVHSQASGPAVPASPEAALTADASSPVRALSEHVSGLGLKIASPSPAAAADPALTLGPSAAQYGFAKWSADDLGERVPGGTYIRSGDASRIHEQPIVIAGSMVPASNDSPSLLAPFPAVSLSHRPIESFDDAMLKGGLRDFLMHRTDPFFPSLNAPASERPIPARGTPKR